MFYVFKQIAHIFIGKLFDGYKHVRSIRGNNWQNMKLRFIIYRQTHGIEKGLSMPLPRYGYGFALRNALIGNLKKYMALNGVDSTVLMSMSVLNSFLEYHRDNNSLSYIKNLEEIEDMLNSVQTENHLGGVLKKNRSDYDWNCYSGFEDFYVSRNSIRDFADLPITSRDVEKILDIARHAPSVCNRQAWNVQVFFGEKAQEVLSFQNGNRGFGHVIPAVLLVTSNLAAFNQYERNQMFVDGGIFSMSILQSIHGLGYGGCPLNLCKSVVEEHKFRRMLGIPIYKEPIMMIGLGHLKEEFHVARSLKKSTNEILS